MLSRPEKLVSHLLTSQSMLAAHTIYAPTQKSENARAEHGQRVDRRNDERGKPCLPHHKVRQRAGLPPRRKAQHVCSRCHRT